MDLNKQIIKMHLDNFHTGKICRRQDFVFLFDIFSPAWAQLSDAYEFMGRQTLTGVKQIDAVCFEMDFLLIADSLDKKIHRRCVEKKNDSATPITQVNDIAFPLPNGSIITAIAATNTHYFLLDKGLSLIRIYDKEWHEIKTIGSRMGYFYEGQEPGKQRLGFEFPEDMILDGNRILISDSGNKRLVVLDDKWGLEKIITLPEYPYKFIFCDQDHVVVSDFDRSLMTVSLQYGFLAMTELDFPVDFSPAFCAVGAGQACLLGSEHTRAPVNECVALTFPGIKPVCLAEETGNLPVLMRIMVAENRRPEAREIALAHEELLPEYVRLTGIQTDAEVEKRLLAYVEKTVQATMTENENTQKEISTLSVEFIKKYKAIPNSSDSEAANIDKEIIRRHLFLKLKDFRSRLKQIAVLKNTRQGITDFPDKRFQVVKQGIETHLKGIEENLRNFNEADMLNFIVHYWLFSEEERILFRNSGLNYEKLFGERFLLAILNDFYYCLAELFLNRHKIAEYISFSDREITMYPDKMDIFKQFINKLIQLGKYDDVIRMLKKFPDSNKENVNYFYYRVYLEKGDADNAFNHLKKEVGLYSHRVDLIPELIELNKLSPAEVQRYIDGILQKSSPSIDTHLYVARAFQKIGNDEKAEFYVDRELELFPENKAAMLLKHDLFTGHMMPTAANIDHTSTAYFRKTWETFKTFIKIHDDETTAMQMMSFFTALNFLSLESEGLKEVMDLKEKTVFTSYKKEFAVYLSFMTHFRDAATLAGAETVEKYAPSVYLSAYSTGRAAYDYFFAEAKRLKAAGRYKDTLLLVEDVLKFNPGDNKLFAFLDSF